MEEINFAQLQQQGRQIEFNFIEIKVNRSFKVLPDSWREVDQRYVSCSVSYF